MAAGSTGSVTSETNRARLLERFELWWGLASPALGGDDERRKHAAWTAWQVAHLKDTPAGASEGRTPQNYGELLPEHIFEWFEHLNLHLTEHDERHAGLALRAAWPQVRDYFLRRLQAQSATAPVGEAVEHIRNLIAFLELDEMDVGTEEWVSLARAREFVAAVDSRRP
jgi:hypothetical protein